MEPKLRVNKPFFLKECAQCHGSFGPENFLKTKSQFYPDGYVPICNDCIKKILMKNEFSWDIVDKFCQYMDIPFNPEQFENLRKTNGDDCFKVYNDLFFEGAYEGLEWRPYFEEFKELRDSGEIISTLPLLKEKRRAELQEKWGSNYDDEGLNYLENLYTGLLTTQNISGALNGDQALKICKISYEIDSRIRGGEDFDKLLSSYDKLVRVADFTPRNVKNASDFDSVGELCYWLEKRGFKNLFHDGETRDVVDETIKNIQSWNRRLYTNESGIGEEITKRLELLKSANQLENYYDIGDNSQEELDSYEDNGFTELLEKEEFSPDLTEGGR